MANKYRGEVPIRLDKARVLNFDMNAYAEFQNATGMSIDRVFLLADAAQRAVVTDEEKGLAFAEALGADKLRALIWVGLLHEEESLTLVQAGRLISQAEGESVNAQHTYLLQKVMDAYLASKGKTKEDIEKEVAKKKSEGQEIATQTISTGKDGNG